jgi:hypothetical protein
MNQSNARPRISRGILTMLLLIATGLLSAGSATAAPLPTLSLTLTPSSISVGGVLQSGAVDVVSTATGGQEPSPVLFLLKPGVTAAELYVELDANKIADEPNLASSYGSIVFNSFTAPGHRSEAQTVLQPGQYVALDAEGEKSAMWPRTSFTVTAAAVPTTLPASQAIERSIDFAFRGPSTLHDGELVRFENAGYVVHMDLAVPTRSRASARTVVKDLLAGRQKSIEKLLTGDPISFAGPLSTGGFQQETITARPGWYVQVCFMATQDGRDHTLLGMERIVKIVK